MHQDFSNLKMKNLFNLSFLKGSGQGHTSKGRIYHVSLFPSTMNIYKCTFGIRLQNGLISFVIWLNILNIWMVILTPKDRFETNIHRYSFHCISIQLEAQKSSRYFFMWQYVYLGSCFPLFHVFCFLCQF